MTRILHLMASNFLGGPEKQLLFHASDVRDADYGIVLGSFQDETQNPEFLAAASRQGIETVNIPGGIRPGLVDDLTQYLRKARIDLICTHGHKSNVVGYFAAKHANVPWVPFVRGWTAETWQVTLYERLERRILTRSPWVVCVSPAQARELGRLRRGRRAPLVIQNAVLMPPQGANVVEGAPSRDELGYTSNAFVFGAAGRFSREKGHRHLLEALALLYKMMPGEPIELLLLGEGREEVSLRAQARKLGIEPHVCFAGFQTRPAAWMKVMDCMVQPSLTDGTPNSVLEAMQLGLPVIATSVGGLPDVIENGRSGLLVQPGSPGAMAEAMKKMVRSASLRAQIAGEGQQRVERDFSPQRQRLLLEMLYGSVLGAAFPIQIARPEDGVA